MMPRFQLLLLLILLTVVPPRCSGQRSQKLEDWHSRGLRANPTGSWRTYKLGTKGLVTAKAPY